MSDSSSGMPAAYATELNPAYANFQLPPGSTWVVPPTMASSFNDQFPSFESIDPTAYANFSGGNAGDVTYTSGGATAALAPWNVDPAYTGNSPDAPLLMGPAFPLAGGTENLAAGTYTDPAPGTGSSTYYDFNLGSGLATPTPASLDLTYKTLLDREQGGLLGGLEQFALGLPLLATGAALGGPLLGALAGAAGGGAAAGGAAAGGDIFDVGSLASLGSGLSDAAVPAAGDVFGVGSLVGLGSGADVGGGLLASGADAAGASSDLLGNVMNLYSQAKPYISDAQDLMKVAQAFTGGGSQPQTQAQQAASLLQQPYMSRGLLR